MPSRYSLLLKVGTPTRKPHRRGASSTHPKVQGKNRYGNVLLAAMLWLGVSAMTAMAYNNVKHYLVVDVQRVVINSAFNYATRDQLSSAIAPLLNQSFFTLDLVAIKTRLEKLDWVYRAAVRRQWPNGLLIDVQEQKPIARWGDDSFVNLEGEVFRGNGVLVSTQLPQLRGPAGSETLLMNYFLEFNRLLTRAGLALGELVFDEKNNLSAKLRDGLPIYFGSDSLVEKMQRFLAVYNQALAGRLEQLTYVDLRYSNGIAVLWQAPGANLKEDMANDKSRRNPGEKSING